MSKSKRQIPEDLDFPELQMVADPELMAEKLQRHMGAEFAAQGLYVKGCRIEHLHYHPRGAFKVVLKAKIGREDRTIGEQVYIGGMFPNRREDDGRVDGWLKRQEWVQPKFGPPVIDIVDWQLKLWAFPNDPNLPGLPLLVDSGRVLDLIRTAPGRFGLADHASPVSIEAELTKYVPGQRCGYVYHLETDSSDGEHAKQNFAVYGKAYRAGNGKRAYEIMRQIWESTACQSGRLLLPQPYSFDETHEILWQQAISGRSFAKIAGDLPDLPEIAKEIGARLASLHGIRFDLPQEMTLDYQIEEVRHVTQAIGQTYPEYSQACASVAERLFNAAARLASNPLTPIHASFKFSHIFATERGITFIDFDGANLGDPCYDLGRFIAHVHNMKADFQLDPDIADRTIVNFCQSYNEAAETPVPQKRIDWFTATHLVASQVYRGVKRANSSRINRLLRIANEICPQ